MLRVADPAVAAAKFTSRAQAAAPQYASGVANAQQSWQTNTAAAAQTWADGVSGAVTDGRFAKGVANAGPKYLAGSTGKGATRYGPGVAQAGPAWQTGVTPFLNVLKNLQLPPRQPKGNPANIARVSAVADALRQAKLAM